MLLMTIKYQTASFFFQLSILLIYINVFTNRKKRVRLEDTTRQLSCTRVTGTACAVT